MLQFAFAGLSMFAALAFCQRVPPVEIHEDGYPDEALIAGLEGTVVVAGVKVIQSVGLGLDEKALEMARTRDPGARGSIVHFLLPAKQSRWHLVGVDFHPPEGTSRPVFASAKYPLGSGVWLNAIDEARILAAIGRQGTATISFEVDDKGVPGHFHVDRASEDVWGQQASVVVSEWRFKPGMRNGIPVSVPCTFELAWGERNLSAASIQRLLLRDPSDREIDSGAQAIYHPEPAYTDEARKAKIEGTVSISLIVEADGTPSHLLVVRPLGFGLDERALEAVAQWRYKAAMVNGQPAAIPTFVEVHFH